MSLSADTSTQLVWALANTEAQFAGETVIRPMHLFLGILKVVDAKFLTQLHDVDIPDSERKTLAEVAKQVRHYLEMSADEITRLRRSLRGQLRKGKPEPGEILSSISMSRIKTSAPVEFFATMLGPGNCGGVELVVVPSSSSYMLVTLQPSGAETLSVPCGETRKAPGI